MENQEGSISLLDSVREKTEADKHSLRKKSRITAETDLREYGVPNWASFLIRHVFLFAEYRFPRAVNEYVLYCDAFGTDSAYYFCPHCEITLEREFQAYCDRCGQRLDWRSIHKARCRQHIL